MMRSVSSRISAFAHRAAAHAEQRRQVALRRQLVAGLEAALADQLEQLGGLFKTFHRHLRRLQVAVAATKSSRTVMPRPGRSGIVEHAAFDREALLDQLVDHRVRAQRILENVRGRARPPPHAGRRRTPARRPTGAARGAGSPRSRARRNAHRLGDAAADRQVGLQDVGGAQLDQVAKVEARAFALAGGDRDVRRARTSARPRLSSAVTGSSNQAMRSRARDGRTACASDTVKVPCASHIRSILGPERLARGDHALGRCRGRAVEHADAHLHAAEAALSRRSRSAVRRCCAASAQPPEA